MYRFHRQATGCPAVLTAGEAAGRDRRGLLRTGLAAGASMLAVVGFGAGAAEATTFPGTNGRLAASGPLNTNPLNLGSKLELFTMSHTYVASGGTQNVDPTECRLTYNESPDFSPKFSKDGKKVAYISANNVWTMQLDASGVCPTPAVGFGQPGDPKQLTGDPNNPTAAGLDVHMGGWTEPNAAGESWIFFGRRETSPAVDFEVYKVKIDANRDKMGSEENVSGAFYGAADNASDSQPAVSADGTLLAWTSNRDTTAGLTANARVDVWVASLDASFNIVASTSSPKNMTKGCSPAAEESGPGWSAGTTTALGGTGTNYRLVFQTNRDGAGNYEIYRMDNADTSPVDNCGDNRMRLTNSPPQGGHIAGVQFDATGYDVFPVYSPAGDKICFHSGRAAEHRDSNGLTNYGQWEIYTMDSDDPDPDGTGPLVPDGNGDNLERKTNRPGNDERCGWGRTP